MRAWRLDARTGRFAGRDDRRNGRLEDFRQQSSAIGPRHRPNVVDCLRSAREGD